MNGQPWQKLLGRLINEQGDVFTRMYGGLARLSLARTKNIFSKQYIAIYHTICLNS